jgi:uncharacterized Zn finger protein
MKLTDSLIVTLIEERFRQRGMDYFVQGMVELTTITDTKVTAKCAGTRLYNTKLELKNGVLSGECSCPAFVDFGPCKHMAAVCYAVMEKHKAGYSPSKEYEWRKEEWEHFEKHLMKKSKGDLVLLIMQLMQDEPDLQWIIEQEIED